MDKGYFNLVDFRANGVPYQLFVRNADTLLHILREELGLMSVKPGCENGDCGSCTVLMDNVPVNACHMLAVEADSHHITTIEGLEDTKLQEAFIANHALQCGYCTPGFILNAHALLSHHPDADEQKINEWLESNICRCTGYQEIKEAIQTVQKELEGNG
ncbi:(2Fe-2S)-binding protein [Virgibacillus sp. 179-BFC.A HS]|uniref:(2Fe-2S)-binding protein n=1 Tax=Tigheibacillus jepli TaxID=3035914 RepID=A0ABU5CI63_9BACI|nr:(2Fe-2S)-binding protein [Virgibacillus sp. 179-BFC.A HS]MDY0405656.1 (2Fe-2S)-binding protein [Virgibacillus sp. 179-BFC.A HS]